MQEQQEKMQRKAATAGTRLEHLSALSIYSPPSEVRHTKIICTIGPKSGDLETLQLLVEAGMDIARLNFSRGNHEQHSKIIRNIREAVSRFSSKQKRIYTLGLAVDIGGPEIRTGNLKGDYTAEVELKKGDSITLSNDISWSQKGTAECMYITEVALIRALKNGDNIYLDHGAISLIVKDIKSDAVVCEIQNDGRVRSQRPINYPGIKVDLPAVTQQDKEDLDYAKSHDVDFIFASYVSSGNTIEEIRKILGDKARQIKVVAKIETAEGVDNIDEILEKSDGIMMARGDLGVAIPLQKTFVVQKAILAKCNLKGKPVICATEMLETMVHALRPSPAELSDVTNAVFDGTDCVLLSSATATGSRPIECVSMMSQICLEAESAYFNKETVEDLEALVVPPTDPVLALALAAVEAAYRTIAMAIILPSDNETTIQRMAHLRPRCPIVAVTRYGSVARHLRLCRGVLPLFYILAPESDFSKDMDARTQFGITYGKMRGFIKPDDPLILVTEWHECGTTINTVRVIYASHTEGL